MLNETQIHSQKKLIPKDRIVGLDIIRGIAIVLVIFRHSDLTNSKIKHFGWLGVDLFFVLSGFVISRILFQDYKSNGAINLGRFLSRRAKKILPPFYFFFISMTLIQTLNGELISTEEVLVELFFLQSYFSHIWLHTWSLATEVHFYLIFSTIVFSISKFNTSINWKAIVNAVLMLLALSLIFRTYYINNREFCVFMQTHLRFDGFLVGILTACLYYSTKWAQVLMKNRILSTLIFFVLISPGIYYEGGTYVMNTAGLTSVNIGFGILLLLVISSKANSINQFHGLIRALKWLSFIGISSYSIYLWHLTAKSIVYAFFNFHEYIMTALYLILSLTLGTSMYFLIEKK